MKAAHFSRHFYFLKCVQRTVWKSKSVSSFKWNSMYSLNTLAYSKKPARQAVSHEPVISSPLSFLSHTHTHTHIYSTFLYPRLHFLVSLTSSELRIPLTLISYSKVSTLSTTALYHHGVLLAAWTSYCHKKGATCNLPSVYMATQYLQTNTNCSKGDSKRLTNYTSWYKNSV